MVLPENVRMLTLRQTLAFPYQEHWDWQIQVKRVEFHLEPGA